VAVGDAREHVALWADDATAERRNLAALGALVAGIADGLQAQMLYAEYLRTGEAMLRDRLIDYNRDDLDALIGIARWLDSLRLPGLERRPG
jgi:hypothetical protein